jgi:hypothetical protein
VRWNRRLDGRSAGGRVAAPSVLMAATAADAERWISLREAAGIIGCDDSTVLTYVKRGPIERRNALRNQASSVERFASEWCAGHRR